MKKARRKQNNEHLAENNIAVYHPYRPFTPVSSCRRVFLGLESCLFYRWSRWPSRKSGIHWVWFRLHTVFVLCGGMFLLLNWKKRWTLLTLGILYDGILALLAIHFNHLIFYNASRA